MLASLKVCTILLINYFTLCFLCRKQCTSNKRFLSLLFFLFFSIFWAFFGNVSKTNRWLFVGPLYFKFNLVLSLMKPHVFRLLWLPVCTFCLCLKPSFAPACGGKLSQIVDLRVRSWLDANGFFCCEKPPPH